MSTTPVSNEEHHQPGYYEIRIRGHLENRWGEWFEDLTITQEDEGETRLSGPVADQAMLHGLLRKVRDLGMPLISIKRIEPGQTDKSEIES